MYSSKSRCDPPSTKPAPNGEVLLLALTLIGRVGALKCSIKVARLMPLSTKAVLNLFSECRVLSQAVKSQHTRHGANEMSHNTQGTAHECKKGRARNVLVASQRVIRSEAGASSAAAAAS